jgi:hypothetical protein
LTCRREGQILQEITRKHGKKESRELAVALSALLGLVIGYPCFRFRVVGHYFALVTLALGQVVNALGGGGTLARHGDALAR